MPQIFYRFGMDIRTRLKRVGPMEVEILRTNHFQYQFLLMLRSETTQKADHRHFIFLNILLLPILLLQPFQALFPLKVSTPFN